MRVHYIHLQRSDFTLSNSNHTWQSDVIDLYDNGSYSNYSLVRSNYGLGAIEPMLGATPNKVWVGMQVLGQNGQDTLTDGGIIRGQRYIDTTGLINLASYNVTTPEYSSSCTLDVYQAETSNAIFPGEWVANPGNSIQDGLDFLTNSPRYLVLVLNWNYDPGTVDFFLRVEIDGPIMTPKYRETGAMLAKLPTWMAMSESDYVPATPELATPQSVGGAFLNAIAGEWMDDLFSQITYRNLQLFIDTADVNQMAWCYKTDGPPLYPYSFMGDGVQCTVAYNTWEFYQADSDDDIVLWDEVGKSVYTNKRYGSFTINGTTYAQTPFQVWNAFDDLGLLVSLNRLSEESNSDFRSRILDVYINQPGVGVENFKNAIRRELSLWQFYGSTPDSAFVGATPEVLEIADLENDPVYTQPNGLPTSRFVQLANFLATQYPTTWGQFRWDSAYADLADDTFSGYGVLPLMYDATPWADEQSGIGDQRDLLIYPPAPLAGPHDFGAQLSLRGVNYTNQTQYAPIEVNVTVTPQGTKTAYTNPTETIWFTLTFTRYDSTEVDYFSFQLSSISDVGYPGATPTSASIAAFQIFDSQGVTVPDIFLRNVATGNMTGNRLMLTDVATLEIEVGEWDHTTQAYINAPSSDTFQAWLSTNTGQLITYNSGPVTLDNNSATPTTLVPPILYMQSKVTQTASVTWSGDPVGLTILVNDTGNLTSSSPGTVRIPSIYWDTYVTSNRALNVTLDSANVLNPDGTSTPLTSGTFTVDLIDPSNGTAYTSGSLTTSQTLTDSVLSTSNPVGLQLSLASATNYPITGTTATAFTALLPYPIDGTVDINGPWVNGYAPAAGNNNYLLGTYTFTPADFGVTGIYELDWIGVQTLNDQSVVTWLGSNVPTLTNGQLTVNIYARLSPEPLPQWNPNVHAGIYYEDSQENYLYVNPQTISFSGGSIVLPTTVQQGAPVYVYPDPAATPNYFYRQVAFFDYDATPYQLTLLNKEIVTGNGTSNLYAAYPRINLLSVIDVTDLNNQITLSAPFYNDTNTIPVGVITDPTHKYQLIYSLVDSFYVDNNYQGSAATPIVSGYSLATPGEDDTQTPRAVIVTSNPQAAWAIYESSIYTTSTPTSVALNPLYTAMEEGFIYLSHDDFPLDHFIVSVSPSSVSADGQDYALLSVYTYDVYGNPVPKQVCTIVSQYVLMNGGNSYTFNTDMEGHAVVTLTAPNSIPSPYVEDTITVSSSVEATPVTASMNLMVQRPLAPAAMLRGSPTQSSIRANGTDLQVVFGHLVDANQNPVAGATVTWGKARSNYDLFAVGGTIAASGTVTTDLNGNFTIGPFSSSVIPGYWLMSIQAQGYDAGDVVFWLEYPDNTFGVETIQGLPTLPIQLATPIGVLPPYISGWMHPVYYNDASPVNPITPNLQPNWLPPNWYALPQFEQWQIGLFSSIGTAGDWSTYVNASTPSHPPQAND